MEIAPQIAVDVCATPERNVGGKVIGGVKDCEIAFGTRDISVRTIQEVKLTNPSGIPLTITSIEFSEPLDPSFTILAKPPEIGPGLTVSMQVAFRPRVESDVETFITIHSDAQNAEAVGDPIKDDHVVIIHLAGTGVDNGIPDIDVSPPNCDYGPVAQNGVATCTLQVENKGNRGLVIDDVLFDGDTLQQPPDSTIEEPFGLVGRVPGPLEEIPARTAGDPSLSIATITIRFAPDALGNFQQSFVIHSNDPDEQEIVVPLLGIGVTPPTCAVRILSVDGDPPPAGAAPTVEPLSDVILTAEDSTPARAGGSIASVEWTIVQQPSGSTVSLTGFTSTTTGFTFADGVHGVDLAGDYRVRATVKDDLGTGSTNQCEIAFSAIPTETFLAQLSWDTSSGDMDLHVTKANAAGAFCVSSTDDDIAGPVGVNDTDPGCSEELDCNYSTCKGSSFGTPPDWDGDAQPQTAGDPSLDIDDLDGYGPENINVDQSVQGDYLVGVNYFSGDVNVGNTVRIYIYGQLKAEFFAELGDGEEATAEVLNWWEVCIIRWPANDGTLPCLEDLTDGDRADDCG